MSDISAPALIPGFFSIQNVARLAFTGADRVRYLNGQVTADVKALPTDRAIRACVLSVKGKLDAVVWIWSSGEKLTVEVDAALAEPLTTRFERYIVSDDVEVIAEPVGECVHVIGEAVDHVPADWNPRRCTRIGVDGVDVDVAGAARLLAESSIPRLGEDVVERIRIEHAIPRWGSELDRDTLPAEAGLDRLAVDFHKGCYIGQEVVSRIESVGHANRSLRVFDLVDGPVPDPGANFFEPTDPARPAATVTSVSFALSPAVGLCYIKRGTPEERELESPAIGSRIKLRPCAQPS